LKFPRSPTCRSLSSGAPCSLPKGLTGGGVSSAFDNPETIGPTVRAGRCAAVGVVTELVDVHASFSVGIVARDVPGDVGWRRLGALLEGDGALDVRVTSEDSN